MGLKDLFEEAIGLGRSEDVRRIAVGGGRARTDRAVVSTPGARLRVVRDGRDGETARVVLWAVRNGIPVELADGAPEIRLDGRPTDADAVRVALGGRGR